MIRKIFEELKRFKGKNRIIFITSAIVYAPKILRDKTILTLKFVRPISIIDPKSGRKIKIDNYYEYPFYCYDYSDITNKIEDDSILIDIGAHFGEVTYRYLRNTINQKNIKKYSYMFEANPYNADVIEKLFAKNNMKNYTLFRFGLGSKNMKSMMTLQNPLSYEGSVDNSDAEGGEKGDNTRKEKDVRIMIKRLDDVAQHKLKKVSQFSKIFIKMDVEGYELEVIKGMTKFLKNNDKDKRISLHIEIKQEKTYKEIMKIFKSCMKKVNVKKLTSEDYLFKNF